MARWKEKLQQIQKLRLARREVDEQLYTAKINLGKIENTLRKIKLGETGENQNEEEAEQKRKRLAAQKEASGKGLDLAAKNLHEAILEIYGEDDQRKLISNLDDSIPFLLMPIRIETRFVTTGNIAELWVRVYPDDIAIHTHEKTLTDKEAAEGKKYWKALFDAEKNAGEQKEDNKKNAWSAIALLFGGQRAAWVAGETKPLNWSDDLNSIADTGQLDFPVHDLTSAGAWSRAPRTNILPDRFVVMLYEGDNIVKEQPGNIIPDELFVGPDPLEADKAFVTLEEEQRLVFGESFDWVSDFDKAIANGMGFKIALTEEQTARGFDKILVLGTYLSADETESQQALETLIDNHHYSPKGFSIVKQGTATNNTDQDGSGYTRNDAMNNISYFVETGKPLFDESDDCDGKNLADALGIEYTPLQYIANSDATDYNQAVAMNTALYPSTLGYYFDTMMQPVLDETVQEKLRDFFIQNVSGRGSLPAIRVGDQPYAVLLTSDFSKWRWARQEAVFGTSFLNGLYKTLNQYRTIWGNLLNDIMYIGKPGSNDSEVLMNILGLQPGSVSFYQRIAYSTDDLINRDGFKYGQRYYNDLKNSFNSKNVLLNLLSNLGYNLNTVNGQLAVPQLLRLVYHHGFSTLDVANLIDNVPLSEKDAIRNYTTGKNYINWLIETDKVAALEKQDFGTGIQAPASLLYMQLRRSLLLQLNKASVKWFKKNDIILDQVIKPVNFYNIRPAGDLTKWEVMKAKVAIAAPDHPQREVAVAEYLLTSGKNETEAVFLNDMKSALESLADKSTGELERCFTEHLDTCSYRLDAWESALFNHRLKKQRQNNNADGQQQRKKGIYLGAYGWLENLRPDSRRTVVQDTIPESLRPANNEPVFEYADNGGFVHAPSINHATAAAVLRNGYITHASAEEPDTMAVNLSSERVRRAMDVLDGIRSGQTLEALLGYQFERGLHDKGSADDTLKKLNTYIYDFRDAFPIELHQVQQQGTDAVTETIPANNVVNGVKLSGITSGFPYGATGAVVSATSDEKLAVEDEKSKLEDTLDAIKDLMLSESVYQMVQGNFDRTGAIMNALKDAHIPPEMEVVKTPRSSHFSFTNRVTIQFEELSSGDAGYNPWPAVPMSPRAIMEPGMNKWLKKILGEPQNLVCLVSHIDAANVQEFEEVSVDQLKIQPIDLVYITGSELNTGVGQDGKENKTAMSELESRIACHYRQLKLLDDETQVIIQFLKPDNIPGKRSLGSILPLLRMLKSLITDSRALQAEDFNLILDKDNLNPKGYEDEELKDRILNAQGTFGNNRDVLNGITITLNETLNGQTGDITLSRFFTALDNTQTAMEAVNFNFSNASALQVQNALIIIAAFGMPDTFPKSFSVDEKKKLVLLEQAGNVIRRMAASYNAADELITDALLPANTIDKKIAGLMEAGKLFFGDVFNILPLFSYTNVADIQLSANDRPQLLKYAKDTLKMDLVTDEWLQNVSYVRPKLSKWESIRTIYESINVDAADNTLELLPVQLPYRKKDSWIAVEFPSKNEDDTTFNITHDTISITIHGEANAFTAGKQGGILLDDWTEVIPVKEEITGISFNYDQPNATPPQALLLAVPAFEKGNWDWDELVGILNDTLLRAKLRAVEPDILDKLNKPEVGVLLPALLANFSQYDLDLALDYRTNLASLAAAIPIIPVTAMNL